MNKRQAKKRLKKAFRLVKTSRKTGIGVAIITKMYVDKNGKPCDPVEDANLGRPIFLKRPKIQYFNSSRSGSCGET